MKLKSFLACITGNHQPDYWEEVVFEEAVRLANSLSVAEWDSVCDNWRELAQIAQPRIADLASETDHSSEKTLQMLLDMLSSAICEVVDESVSSLNSLAQDSIECLEGLPLKDALNAVEPTAAVRSRFLRSLKARIAKSSKSEQD